MIRHPSLCLVYVFVTGGNAQYSAAAHKFATKMRECPSGIASELLVVCNGPTPTKEEWGLFDGIPNRRFITDDDRAYDISAFQTAATQTDAELMVMVGGSTWPTRPCWGARIVEVYRQYGPAIYGAMGNQGDRRVNVWPHLRSTGFWMQRELFNAYPYKINHVQERYPFEHGKTSLTGWVRSQGMPALVVGWHDVVDLSKADSLPNGFHRGDQSNIIFRDRLTEPPYYHA